MTVAHNIDVLLQAKTEGFDKKLKDSSKKTKEFADKAKPWINSVFGGGAAGGIASGLMTGGAIGAGAAAAMAAIDLVKSGVQQLAAVVSNGFNSLDQLGDVAKKIGISGAGLATLQLAADQSGSNVEDLNASLAKMVRNISEASAAGGPAADALAKIGLDADQLQGMAVEDQFKAIADGVSKLGNAGDRLSIINDIFGKTGSSLNELLSGGAAGIDEFAGKASKLGLIFSDGEIAKVQEAQDAYAMVGHAVSGLGQSFAVALAPLATGIFTLIADNIGGITEALHPVFELIREWTPAIIQMASITISVFTSIIQICWEWRDVIVGVIGGPIALAIMWFLEYIVEFGTETSEMLAWVEAAITHWDAVWEVCIDSAALSLVTFGNDCIHIFGTVLPNLINNWADAMMQQITAMVSNVGNAWKYIKDIVTKGHSDVKFDDMFSGYDRAIDNLVKDLDRPATELEQELQKQLDEHSSKLVGNMADDVAKRMAEMKGLITDDVNESFANSPLNDGEIETTVTTKLAPGALERGSSAAFEAIINAQEKQGDPLLTEAVKGNKLQQEANRQLAEIANKKNELAVANFR